MGSTESDLIKKFHDEWCIANGYKPQAPSFKHVKQQATSRKLQAPSLSNKRQASSRKQQADQSKSPHKVSRD
jgi:hypothetical protein